MFAFPPPGWSHLRPEHLIAATAAAAFSSFYCLYAAAAAIYADATPTAGIRVGLLMAVVVAVQPVLVLLSKRLPARKQLVATALALMAGGMLSLPVAGGWPGLVSLGAGFGIFVVASTAWVKEVAPVHKTGRAMGIYGLGSATGGALGAPAGLTLTTYGALPAVAVGGASLTFVGLVTAGLVPPQEPSLSEQAQQPHSKVATGSMSRSWAGNLVLHLLAVSVYATVLSTSGHTMSTDGAFSAIVTAFFIQLALAVGRSAGGFLADRASAAYALVLSVPGLVLAASLFFYSAGSAIAIAAGGLVGFTAGTAQTAALTGIMRQTRAARQINAASAAWNITFDIGLGAGALTAGLLPYT